MKEPFMRVRYNLKPSANANPEDLIKYSIDALGRGVALSNRAPEQAKAESVKTRFRVEIRNAWTREIYSIGIFNTLEEAQKIEPNPLKVFLDGDYEVLIYAEDFSFIERRAFAVP